ncbi:MAG TPA: DUF1501 domain-containing protein [Burkholderiaceae bacterium]|nr:DUF1501 domain-containing protein [Burkholderiaceae bacterium]
MDRREFLLNTAKASGVVLPWWGLLPLANAQTAPGKILLYVHAGGGIDHDSWTDPAIGVGLNNYTTAGTPVVRVGRIAMAPMGNNAAFATRFVDQMLLVNQVNTETNSHEDGTQRASTGKLEPGFAPICELHAAKYGPGYAAAWMNRDDARAAMSTGLVSPTPVPNGDQLRAMVLPNSANATTDFVKQTDYAKAVAVRTARLEALKAAGVMLPKERLLTEQVIAGKEARVRLEAVAANIPQAFNQQFADIQVGLIAAQSGITAAIQVERGGFDSHGNIEDYNGANGSLTRLTNALTFAWDEAAARGLTDRLVVMVGSEFGRSQLNPTGKDHNNVGGTYLFMLPPGSGLGNRTVGYSGPRHEARTINPKTGAPDPAGVMLRPHHVHDAVRDYLGINLPTPNAAMGVMPAEKLNLFNASMITGHPSLPA